MTIPTLGVAFAAFCVWLTVRIINRRERWAKWVLAAVVGLPVLYVASFGPACWLSDHEALPYGLADSFYGPLMSFSVYTNCNRALEWYGTLAGLAELPLDPEVATDCRFCTTVRIRLDVEVDHPLRQR